MRRTLTAICIAIAPAITSAQQAITITSPPDTFAVNSTAQATVRKDGPFLKVAIERHTIWASKKFNAPNHIVSYTAAIATNNNEGQWETSRKSAPIETTFTLNPGETRQMPPTTLLIPIDGIEHLDKHWIVLVTRLRSQKSSNGYGHTYAHSEALKLAP